MAKKRIENYTFDASEKKITFTDYTTITLDSILLIVNVTDQIIVYNFADTTLGGTVATNVLTLEYDSVSMDDADKLLIYYDDATSVEAVSDWTAVAQNTVAESATINNKEHNKMILNIQAFLDTTTAHTGTRFIVQTSSTATGDEDWQDYTEFVGLIGTAATDLIEDNPLAVGSTSITLTGHALTVRAKWLAIEDGTLANSELIFEVSSSANAVVILDGTTNAHNQNVAIFNVALTQVVLIDSSVRRVRVVVDNSYDSDGSTLNFKVRLTRET